MAELKQLDNRQVSTNIHKRDDEKVSAVVKAGFFKNRLVLIATIVAFLIDVSGIGLLLLFGYELISLVMLCIFTTIELGIIVFRLVAKLNIGSKNTILIFNIAYILPIIAYLYLSFVEGLWGFLVVAILRVIIQTGIIAISMFDIGQDESRRASLRKKSSFFFAVVLLLCFATPVYAMIVSPATGNFGDFGRSAIYSVDKETGDITLEYFLPGFSSLDIPESATVFANGKFVSGTVTTLGENAFSNISDIDSVKLPSTISKVDARLFSSGSVKSLTVTSNSLTLLNEEDSSIVGEIILFGDKICDISYSQNVSNNIHFTVDRKNIDSYRLKYSALEDKFAPELEDDELYINFNNSEVPTAIVKTDNDGFITIPDPTENIETTRIENGREQRFIWWRLSSEGDVEKAVFPIRTNVSLNLYATWASVYKVSYTLNDGEAKGALTNEYYYSGGDVSLPDAEKDGYTFMGWYLTDNKGDYTDKVTTISQSDTNDYNLSAKFLKNYNITYNWNGGIEDNSAPTYYHAEMDEVTLPSSTRRGYTFAGWKTSGGSEISSIEYGSEGDMLLTAQWDIINYSIEYINPLMCDNNNVLTYNIESNDITLDALERLGYAFDGWYIDSNHSEIIDGVAISSGSIGNKVFYAKWTLLPPAVSSSGSIFQSYDGQEHALSIIVTYLDKNMSIHYSWEKDSVQIPGNASSLTVKNVSDSGEYSCTVWLTDGDFVSSSEYVDINVNIKKTQLQISANDNTIIYGQLPSGAGVTFTGFVASENESVLNGTLSYDFDYGRFDDIGSNYLISPKGFSADNYDLDYQTGTLAVNPLAINVSWSARTEFIYTGSEFSILATITNIQNNDAISLDYSNNSGILVNSYTAQITDIIGEKRANYTLNGVLNLSQNWEIANANISGSLVGYSGVFDGQQHDSVANNTLTAVDGTALTLTYSLSSNGAYASAIPTLKNVEVITIYYKATAANHNEKGGSFEAVISPKEISIDWCEDNFTYNGTDQASIVSASYKDVENNSISLTVEFGAEFKHYNNVGYVAVVAFSNGESNYTLPSSYSKTYHIKKKAATVIINNGSSVYYSLLVSLTATDSGIIAGDNAYELQTTATSTSVVGNYPISGRIINNDYDITFTPGTYSITPATISSVVVTGYNSIYDGQSHNADISSSASSLGNQKVKFLYGTEQGTYNSSHISVQNVSDSKTYYYKAYADNHEDYFGSFVVTISTLDISGASIVLGNALVYSGVSQTQLVSSVTKNNMTVTYSISGNTGTDAQSYTLTVSGTNNFSGTETASWNISALDISGADVVLGSALIFNGNTQTQTVSSVKKNGLTVTYTTSGNTGVDANEYTMVISGTGNFCGTTTKNWTIDKSEFLSVNIVGYSGVFDGITHNADASVSIVAVGGETATVLFGTSQGTYNNDHISVVNVSDSKTYYYKVSAKNHKDVFGSFSVTISALDISGASVSLGNSLIYTEAEQTQSVSSVVKSGLPVTYTVSNNKGTNAKTYTLTVYGTDNFSGTVTKDWTIAPKEVVIVWCDDAFIYDGSDQSSSVTATYRDVNNNNVALTVSLDDTFKHYKQSGYLATASFANEETNYSLPISTVKTYHISQKQISVVIENKTSVYGQEIVSLTASASGIIVGDDNVYSLSTSALSTSPVGSYDIVGHVGTNSDYIVTFTNADKNSNKGTYVITPAIIVGDIVGYSGDYDCDYHDAVVSNTLTGVAGADINIVYSSDVGVYSSSMPKYINAGEYTVYYKASANNHAEKSGSFTVTIEKISYDLTGMAWDYSEAYIYDGVVKSVILTGIPEGLTPSYQNNSFANSGKYTATVTFSFDSTNYSEPTFTSLVWEIRAAKVSVPVIGSKEYSGITLTADIVGNEIYRVLQNNGGLNAGEYDVILQLIDSDNYYWDGNEESETVVIKFSITKVVISAPTIADFSFNDDTQKYVYNGDNDIVLCLDNGNGVGEHNVTVSIIDKDNYIWSDGDSDDKSFDFTISEE